MSIQNYLQERIGLNRLPIIGVSTNSRDIDEQVLVADSRAFRDYLQANETESKETWSFCSYRGYQLLSDEGQNSQRFEDIEKGWDFKDRNFGVIDGREVILDFPWHSEPWDGEDETAGKRLYTF